MKATSLLAMTAALSLLVGTSAAFAQEGHGNPAQRHGMPNVEIDVDVLTDWDKYDLDGDLGNSATQTITENTIIQNAQINEGRPSSPSVKVHGIREINNAINIADVAQNAANIGDVQSTGTMTGDAHAGRG